MCIICDGEDISNNTELDIICNNIIALPELPNSLKILDCQGCTYLESIPDLPNSLEYLKCDNCISLVFGPERAISQVGKDVVETNYQKWRQKKCSEMYNPKDGKLFEDLIKVTCHPSHRDWYIPYTKTVITFGTFDLFHIGHKRLLERAATYGDYLVVGISSDELNKKKKNRYPIYSINERLEIISALKFVNEVFIEESLDKKREYITNYNANVFVIGDDWKDKFNDLSDICNVVYLPRTPSISTTEIIEKIA